MNTTNEALAQNNKLIAEFLGYDLDFFTEEEQTCLSSDWNFLMEAVEKIESLDFNVTIQYKNCYIDINKGLQIDYFAKSKIEAVYNACIEFIKWYNQNGAETK